MDATSAITGSGFKNSTPMTDTQKEDRLRQACADFEAIILEKFLSMARQSAPKEGLLGGGFAEEMYRSLHDQELAQQMAAGRGMGFGEQLYRQIGEQHYRK